MLHRLYRDVYAVGHTALSREARWLAAVFAAGEGAALCRRSAVALLALDRWAPNVPEVLVPRPHRAITGIKLHTARRLDSRDVTTVDGIPVTNVPRVFVDLSDGSSPRSSRATSTRPFRGILDLGAIRRAMARATGHRHLDVLECAIDDWLAGSAGVRSRGELAFRRAVAAAGLPRPDTNRKFLGVEVDFHWPDLDLVIELDGPGHLRPPSRAEDARRDAHLAGMGYRVVRCRTPEAAIAALADAFRRSEA
ncbi:DUF559 domain-containing protein [Solirubrobacter deserti]|uniref:Endonuclease domain-containing protein n=1 Tax=Solirubrobacter deserti TaxID=2282478 RepID=A0ABT4RTY6_9ACTN|nr:DUF559 domain-containing protein [Solirubrobacter deserti]MDA0142053.1 endonuclease domain-containing protein [Solirubrobacter deserti]